MSERRAGPPGELPDGSWVRLHGLTWVDRPARASGAVVLPVACRGTRRPEHGRRFRSRVDVLVGEPVEISAGPGGPASRAAALGDATERIRGEPAALVTELDERRAA